MRFAIIDSDGNMLDEVSLVDGKVRTTKRDAINQDRRDAYHQQRHIQAALHGLEVKRRKKGVHERVAVDAETGEVKMVQEHFELFGCSPVSTCGRYPIVETAKIMKGTEGRMSVAGVKTCTSVWACPVCGRKILRQRGQEIRTAIEAFGAKGWVPMDGVVGPPAPCDRPLTSKEHGPQRAHEVRKKWMVTLTARHKRETDLKDFATRFRNARRRLARNRGFIAWRNGSAGYITVAEITWSQANGWHWHVHELWIDTPSKPAFGRLWKEMLGKEGLTCVGKVGYDVTESWDASEYLSKLGSERDERWDTAKEATSHKKGKSMWDLAPKRHDLVVEHFLATRGMRRISWSKGLKAMVGLDEVSDAEAANMEEGVVVVEIEGPLWRQIQFKSLVPDVLEAAEAGGAALVQSTLGFLIDAGWSDEAIKEQRDMRALHAEMKRIMSEEME